MIKMSKTTEFLSFLFIQKEANYQISSLVNSIAETLINAHLGNDEEMDLFMSTTEDGDISLFSESEMITELIGAFHECFGLIIEEEDVQLAFQKCFLGLFL
jgi:hypothetical protein